MSTILTINNGETGLATRNKINSNFANLNADLITAEASISDLIANSWVKNLTVTDANTIQNTVTSDISAQTGVTTFVGLDWDITRGARTSTGAIDFIKLSTDGNKVFNIRAIDGTAHVDIGSHGLEENGINIGGSTYKSALRVNDYGAVNEAQFIVHRHSTTLAPVILGARANNDTTSHTAVTTGQSMLSIYGSGYTGSMYNLFGSIEFEADIGTISDTSSPGKIVFKTTPDSSNIPVTAMEIMGNKEIKTYNTLYMSQGKYIRNITNPLTGIQFGNAIAIYGTADVRSYAGNGYAVSDYVNNVLVSSVGSSGYIDLKSANEQTLTEIDFSALGVPAAGTAYMGMDLTDSKFKVKNDAGATFVMGGAFTADSDTQITPSTAIVLDHATNNEVGLSINYTTNKAAGNDTGLLINQTDTLSPNISYLFDAQVGGISQLTISNNGDLTLSTGDLFINSSSVWIKSAGATSMTLGVNGSDIGKITSAGVTVNNVTGGIIRNVAAGLGVANINPHNLDSNTGIGGDGNDILTLLAGGFEGIRIEENTGVIRLGFYTAVPVIQATAMTTADVNAPNSGDATTDTLISNLRTRINELEAMLSASGGGIGVCA
jgi:hypothetical protein